MSRPHGSSTTPTYRHHKPTGRAVTTLDGRDYYLGPHGTPSSKREYDRLISEWLAGGRQMPVQANTLTLVELINLYRKHAEIYYGDSGERASIVVAMRQLNKLYGHTTIGNFGPLALKAVREAMVGIGWSRKYINVQVGRIIRMFRWGVENEKVEANVLHALRAVPGLRQGKTTARELPPIRPVPDSQVAAVLPHVPAPVKAMIELMQLTGARAGELVILRGSDIDMTGPVWQYRPEKHKTQFHGHERIIYLGPRAQDVVRPFLRLNPAEYLFRPDESIAAHREKRKAARKTPLSCGNCPGDVKQSKPKKLPGEHYSVGAFRQAIERGCDIAFPPPSELARIRVPGNKTKNMRQETTAEWKARLGERWTELKAWRDSHSFNPHQIRHSCATTIRKQYGLEVVQAVLGQKSVSASQIYAEKNLEAATRVMAEVG